MAQKYKPTNVKDDDDTSKNRVTSYGLDNETSVMRAMHKLIKISLKVQKAKQPVKKDEGLLSDKKLSFWNLNQTFKEAEKFEKELTQPKTGLEVM